jgi:hypothetical protein
MRYSALVLFAAMSLQPAFPLSVTRYEFGLGIGSDLHGGHGTASSFTLALPRQSLFDVEFEPNLGFLALDSRSQRNGRPRGDTHVLFLENRFRFKRFYFASGISARDHDTDALSTRFNFVNGFGIEFGNFSFTARHYSNAGTGGLNRGENTFMLNYHF